MSKVTNSIKRPKIKMFKYLIFTLLLLTTNVNAESVDVKYRGLVDVDNGKFSQLTLKPSTFIHNMYYDDDNQYLLVQLTGVYYQYCAMPSSTVNSWVSSASLGRFYNANIKGEYDCRITPPPKY